MNLERLYLDYNATSPLSQSVSTWLKSGDLLFANPSSQHSDGKASRKLINEARAQLYKVFGKEEKSTRLMFHSGATESFHAFAYSFSEMARLSGRELLICYSKVDHPAVTSLGEKYFGAHVKVLELQRDNNLGYLHRENLEILQDKKDNNPDLIILYHHLWVHNETGLVSPLSELLPLKAIADLYIHVDAVQAPGKIENWNALSVGDIWTFSGHKFGSLKGIGFTFFPASLEFHPLISGGGQQGNLRSGTENVTGVKSLSQAMDDLLKVPVQETRARRRALVQLLEKDLEGMGKVIDYEEVASNTIYFYFHDLASDVALALFDLNGLEISAGSACSSGAAKDSAVLLQMGLQPYAKNGLRLSLPLTVNEELLNKISGRLSQIFNKLRKP